ncbi:MAG: IgGFc-binding protein [Deltaproteobacteria bacterium]|jgi:hypothetical protein|nr:IgGFc-binding protein [Deltaproteobacteria bacterium]
MNRKIFSLLSIASLFLFLVVACSPDDSSNNNGWNQNNTNNVNNTNNQICSEGDQRCFANTIQNCTNGQWINDTVCGMNGELPVCDDTSSPAKCAECIAGGTICGDDNNVHTCTANGEIGLVERECDSDTGETCIDANGSATCDSPCLRAAAKNSYRGCNYWLTSMANEGLDPAFAENFAVVIDNSNDVAANVTITGNGQNHAESIEPNTLSVILLPFNEDIRTTGAASGESLQSGIYRATESRGGYHIETTLPVTVYQFSPYDYVTGSDVYSYSNDASLILPTPVLSTNYIIMSRPTMSLSNGISDLTSPGVMTVIAPEDNTTVTVQSSAHTAGGSGVGALTPGQSMNYQLNQGDVLQIVSSQDVSVSSCPGQTSGPDANGYEYCDPGSSYDLTGTKVTSNKPVAVWGGHNCDFIPFDYWACDHLEEMMIPLETWGNHFYIGLTHPVESGTDETNVIRILSGENGVNVSFNPAFENPATLNEGEYIEFLAPVEQHFEINATGPIMVGKFTVGQNYWTDSSDAMGDPAFGLVVPVEQYRSEYSFATPESMSVNYVNVIAQIPTDSYDFITIDGESITAEDYQAIGDTGYGVARIDITSTGTNGSHRIEAPNESITFGIEVYGFANYTSYLYPGGLDLEYINPIE